MQQKIRWGVMAPGHIAHKFAADMRLVKGAELAAVASRDIQRSNAFAKKHGTKSVYGDYQKLADDPEIDIIYIATPHSLHHENTMMCLAAGKNVLCEKPMAMNSGQLTQMITKAKEKNLFLMEALWTRFIPSYIKFRELALSGAVGEIKLIRADFGFNAPTDPGHRLLNRALGGGALLDIGIYPVFLALDILGAPDAMSAKAIFTPTGVDETISIIFEYQQKNVIAELSATIAASTPVEATVHGVSGCVKLNRFWHAPSSVEMTIGDHKEFFTFEEQGNGYQYEIMEANACIRQGKRSSELFSLSNSSRLHSTLDQIRAQVGLSYDADK